MIIPTFGKLPKYRSATEADTILRVTSMTRCMSARFSWIAGSVLKSNGAEALTTPTQKLNPVPNNGVEMRTPAMPAKYEPVACSGLPDVGTCKEVWLLVITPDNK